MMPDTPPHGAHELESVIGDYLDCHAEEIHGVVVGRTGHPTVEQYRAPYTATDKHILNSCTKSFLSALVGIAIDKGHLTSVAATVLDYFPDFPVARADPLRTRVTVEHLLTMSSGIAWPQSADDNASDRMVASPDWIAFILDRPMAAEPGTVANYSNGDAHLLSATLERATGLPTVEFARKHLFAPLGITDIRWDRDPTGVTIGSATLYLTPRDMAKLGLLFVSEGRWGDRQVIPRHWIRAATTPHVRIPSGRPIEYGYYWWIHSRHDMFEAWGGEGQRIACFPCHQVVVATTARIDDDGPISTHAAGLYDAILGAIERAAPR